MLTLAPRVPIATVAAVVSASAVPPTLAGGADVTPIAVNGDTLPGGAGIFISFEPSVLELNDSGVVAFLAGVSGAPGGASQGVFTGVAGATTEIALMNATVPGADGQFSSFTPDSIDLNALGELVFHAILFNTSGGFSDDRAIFLHDGATLSTLVREGMPAPEGVYSGFMNGRAVRINDNSDVVFQCNLNGTDHPAFLDTVAIVRKTHASESFVVQGADPAFGGPGDFQPAFDEDSVLLNNAGQTLFWTTYANGGVLPSNDTGFSRSNPAISVLREGDALGGGTVTGMNVNNPQLNDNGDSAISVSLSGVPSDTNSGIVLSGQFIAREGDVLPGVGAITGLSGDHRLNNNAQVAYKSSIVGQGSLDDEIILRSVVGAHTLISRENDIAPDGVTTIDVFRPNSVRINDAGQVAFVAQLNDNAELIDAILLYDDALGVVELAREGDALAGSTILAINDNIALNDAGQVAFTGALALQNRAFLALTDPLADPPCNPADLAEPLGSLDFSDVVAFLTAFGAMAPQADLAEPFGQFDFSDVVAFLAAFGAGCP